MDSLLIFCGFLCLFTGILGSFLPVLPGPPMGWVGLLLAQFTSAIEMNYIFLGVTFFIAIIMVAADYLIPIATTKKFGGSRYGVIGTTLGILFGIFIPIPMGIFVGAFIGAFIGERIHQNDHKVAIKAALGSLIGFMTSSLLKFVVSLGFMGLFLYDVWTHRDAFL